MVTDSELKLPIFLEPETLSVPLDSLSNGQMHYIVSSLVENALDFHLILVILRAVGIIWWINAQTH